MKLFETAKKHYYLYVYWDWKWFGFEVSFNGHEKYLNISIAWLQINLNVGRF